MFKFTKREVIDLLISFVVISIGFCILYSGRDLNGIIALLPIIMLGVGCGFIFHELGHKLSAMHYGYWAEYKMWVYGLVIALISSFFGFIFAAPGAVYIYGPNMTDRENGIISLAGPIINIAITLIFLVILFSLGNSIMLSETNYIIAIICIIGAKINSFLALFNLLPIPTLDGSKVLKWNIPIWLVTIAVAGILVYFTMFNIVM
ncbi:MAG: site-2 protease family protein [archaeon]|nr:site-2 protease family protein [archaeon]